jgi:hypothetical protein
MSPRLAPLSLALALASLLLACSAAGSSTDPEPLGYGPAGVDLPNGYDEIGSPFERPSPLAWPLLQQPTEALAAWTATPPVLPASPSVAISTDVRLVCVHVVDFLLAKAEASNVVGVIDSAELTHFCHFQARTEKLSRTTEQWQAFSACMLAADSDPEFDACETNHPSALAEPTAEHEREREACQHLVMTTLYEELGSDANLPVGELEQFRPVIHRCIDELIADEQIKRSPEDYDALLDCVLGQSTSVAMEACE